MTQEQYYSDEGQELQALEQKKDQLLKKQGYYSKGVAKLSNRIVKLKEKIEKLYPSK